MKFLIEELLITPDELDSYSILSDKNKVKFIKDFINKQPNKKYIEYNLTSAINAISEYGFDPSDNKYLEFLINLNIFIDQEVLNLIFELIGNNKIKPTDEWLFNKSLYTENTRNIIEKIKIIAFANNPRNITKYKVEFSPTSLMKNNSKDFLELADMNKVIDEWQARVTDKEKRDVKEKETREQEREQRALEKEKREQEKEQELLKQKSEPKTVEDYLRTLIKPYDADNIRKFIINNTDFKNEQKMVNKFIEEGELDDYIEEVLKMNLKSSMGKSNKEVLAALLNKYIYSGYRKAAS